jgi:hypothetical protein
MKTSKIVAFGVVAVLAAYGCGVSDEEDTAPDEAQSEDQLILGRGSVDHAAIVEVTTMMLTQGPFDFGSVLDPYNQSDPFRINPTAYRETFGRNLAKFDVQDGRPDWSPAQANTWVSRVASGNYIVVDTSKPCSWDDPHTYLEIERAQLTGRPHTTCGGRMPNEDALDVTLNFLIRGPAASADDEGAMTDGVDQATKQATRGFPYLGEMNGI